jgi:hypothetical protein
MIADFRKKWTVHVLEQFKLFFGIRFICSKNCITLNQTHKVKTLIINVFSPSYDLSGQGYTTLMIPGTKHSNGLAACTAYSAKELQEAQMGESFGFNF